MTDHRAATSAITWLPEIVELIFVEVPAVDLITNCRAVCKQWKAIVETSAYLGYYIRTGLIRPGTEKEEIGYPNSIKLCGLTPLAFEVVTRMWWKLGHCVVESGTSGTLINRDFLLAKFEKIYRQFYAISHHVTFLREPFELEYAMCRTNWVEARISHKEARCFAIMVVNMLGYRYDSTSPSLLTILVTLALNLLHNSPLGSSLNLPSSTSDTTSYEKVVLYNVCISEDSKVMCNSALKFSWNESFDVGIDHYLSRYKNLHYMDEINQLYQRAHPF